ncbi:MAG: hypothetical protein QM640_02480, partial [Niabella sp.]
MYRILLFIAMYLCVNVTHAQIHTLGDTLSSISPELYRALQTERGKRLKTDSLYLETATFDELAFMQTNTTQLIADTLKQAATLKVAYGNARRNLKLPT